MHISQTTRHSAGRLIACLRDLLRDRRGATAVEYGLIAGGISVAIIIVIFVIGGEVNGVMEGIRDMLAAKN